MEDQLLDDVLSQMIEQESSNNSNPNANNIQFPDFSSLYNSITQSGNNDDMTGLESTLIGMITPFLGKEMLYEPMKELRDHFPQWLENNKSKLSTTEFEQHSKQYEICAKIVRLYEDNSEPVMNDIVELLQQMGTPPQSLSEYLSELQ
ncbi:Peroxisomal biogenesis factor [Entamoeba marina]